MGSTVTYAVSHRFEHGVGSGVDDVGEPGRVVGIAGGRPCDARSRVDIGVPLSSSSYSVSTKTRAGSSWTDQRHETKADAPASRKALANPPTVVKSSPERPVWQALSTTSGPPRPGRPSRGSAATSVELRYCSSTVRPRRQPLEEHLGVRDVVGARGAVAGEVEQVEAARRAAAARRRRASPSTAFAPKRSLR